MSQTLRRNQTPPIRADWARWIERGKAILAAEQRAIGSLQSSLELSFSRAVELLWHCEGHVVTAGMGKAGIIAQKLAATLSSTGTPSYFLHPAEAVHGDLGSVRPRDIALFLSHSGETDELNRLLPCITKTAAATIAITAHPHSTLGRAVDLPLLIGQQAEACALGLAPSCSTTAMLALGDALALVVSEQRGFSKDQFAKFHPGGGLGKQLTRVDEVMRPLRECRVAVEQQTVREVLIHVGRPGRRTGAVMLTDTSGELVGIFTDSDLARLLETSHDNQLDCPIAEVMTRRFQTIQTGSFLPEAMRILAQRKISELPVVDADRHPLGIVDITDVMAVMSEVWSQVDEASPPFFEVQSIDTQSIDTQSSVPPSTVRGHSNPSVPLEDPLIYPFAPQPQRQPTSQVRRPASPRDKGETS